MEGGLYYGQAKISNREGYGVQVWADSTMFNGFWKDGKAHRSGKFTFNERKFYDGEWNLGKQCG